MFERLLDVHDLAKYLNVSERTIHRLITKNKLPGFKVGGQLRFSEEEVADWLKRNRIGDSKSKTA